MSDRLELLVGVIEWADDSIEVDAVLGTTRESVQAQVRSIIEGFYGSFEDEDDQVWEYVRGPASEISDWTQWHDGLHEIDGTPWVSIMERVVDDA